MVKTTDLEKITFGTHSNFTWGEAIKRHDLGIYSLIEYHPHEYDGNYLTGKIDYNNTEYSCYVEGHNIGRSAGSLEYAIALCLAYKADGINSSAAMYFIRMIGLEE